MGAGAWTMESSIWVATTTGLPASRQAPTMRFCALGTSSGGISTPRSPRATMTASASWISSSRWVSAWGFSILTMMAARLPISRRASATSSGRWTKDSAIQSAPRSRPNCEIGAVLVGERGNAKHDVGQVEPLAIAQASAGDDGGFAAIALSLVDPEADAAIVEQQFRTGVKGGKNLGMGQRGARHRAGFAGKVETEAIARHQIRAAAFKGSDAQLGALQIDQHADGPAKILFDLAHMVVAPAMILVSAVAQIHAEDVGAGLDQCANLVGRAAGRTQRRQDLRHALASHGLCLIARGFMGSSGPPGSRGNH